MFKKTKSFPIWILFIKQKTLDTRIEDGLVSGESGESGQVVAAWTNAGAEERGVLATRGRGRQLARCPTQSEHLGEDKVLSQARES